MPPPLSPLSLRVCLLFVCACSVVSCSALLQRLVYVRLVFFGGSGQCPGRRMRGKEKKKIKPLVPNAMLIQGENQIKWHMARVWCGSWLCT